MKEHKAGEKKKAGTVIQILDGEQITKTVRNPSHALRRTERTEQSEFTNEMSNRALESPQVTNNGKTRAILRRLNSTVLLLDG